MDNNIQQFNEFKLSENILKALNNLGFLSPSDVQKEAIPRLLNKEDIIVKSQTGSGKTASYGIPICDRVEIENSNIQALVLVPTRELALQVKEDISNIGRLKKIRCDAIFGKQPFNEQVRKLKQRVHIVVGTPGRVIDHIERGNLTLKNLKFVVIDEADKMLNMGFVDQIKKVLENIPKLRTTALFSATIPQQIENLCSDYMKEPKILNIKSNIFNRDKIKESYLEVEDKNKFKLLWRKLYSENPEAAIVFCNTKDKVKNIFAKMKKEGFLVEELHGDMEQKDRIKTMERFKNKEFKVLIATDIAARGIHISNITHVLNYEVPMEKESYVHRIGRTGRAGKEGKAITFVSNYEKKFLKSIEEYIGYEVKKDIEPKDEEVKEGKVKFKESQKELKKNLVKVKQSVHKEITKIHLSGGKKKKIRVIDIVGALSNLKGLTGDDIGIIDIKDGFSYVDILNGKGNLILKKFKEITIKGKKIKLQKAKN
ncbi:DEAD/DEAH box helicase [Clostridium oceanicum]|uniref:ATP-dependent RNA helicase DbpA n=1 Tax=Clostridium oceanicum TaxID=1543 RepID=A0ABP3UNP3_9CLOT